MSCFGLFALPMLSVAFSVKTIDFYRFFAWFSKWMLFALQTELVLLTSVKEPWYCHLSCVLFVCLRSVCDHFLESRKASTARQKLETCFLPSKLGFGSPWRVPGSRFPAPIRLRIRGPVEKIRLWAASALEDRILVFLEAIFWSRRWDFGVFGSS